MNNESAAMVDGVCLRVEMQTASNKVLLAEMGGPTLSLVAGDTLEASVHHEIKELGQHVLACIVSYQLPPGARRPATSATTSGGSAGTDEEDDAGLQTFPGSFTSLRCVIVLVEPPSLHPAPPFLLLD